MTKVTLKTLQQQTFTIDIDESQKVSDLKEKIAKTKGADYAVSNQKLIYAGKILEDESTIASYNIEESKFIVVMITKPKAPPAAAEPAKTTSATSSTPIAAAAPEPKPSSEATPVAQPTAGPDAASASGGGLNITAAESSLVLGADYENTVSKLCEMGYPRSEVEKALRASFNNPDRAVEYLLSGIPEQEEPVAPSGGGPEQPQAPTPTSAAPAAAPASLGGQVNPLEFLRTQPQFQQMREVIRQNPNLLSTVMQQIGSTNPDLLRLITENQQAFVQMLNEPPTDAGPEAGGGLGGEGGPDLSSYMGSATITNDDKQAIERLKALGFAEYLVVQAYFACDKNENMAADFLFSQGDDD